MPVVELTSNRVLHEEHDDPSPGTIVIDTDTGKIVEVRQTKSASADHDYGDLVIMPGLVDAHVHLNEPGRTDWEGFETGSRAAISGGVTTLVDMPLNAIPPTTTIENFDIKRAAAIGKCHTDMAFWGGVIPGNQDSLKPLVKAGVRGFKCFTIESGVDEFPCVGPEDIDLAMDELDGTGSILMFHAEVDAGGCGPTHESHTESDPDLYKTFLESRPQSFEVDAITQIIAMAKRHPGLRLHIVHLAAAQALPILEAAQAAGVAITAETCFHYLTFDSGEIPSRATQYKCCPPIRDGKNRELLWDAIERGIITTVVSDHSPCTVDLKRGSFMNAWGGVSALGLGLQVLWTGASARGWSLGRVRDLTTRNTAKQVRLWPQKGRLAAGSDADLCIFDPDALWTVSENDLYFKNKVSPYVGRQLRGRVEESWLAGQQVWQRHGRTWSSSPRGRLLLNDAI